MDCEIQIHKRKTNWLPASYRKIKIEYIEINDIYYKRSNQYNKKLHIGLDYKHEFLKTNISLYVPIFNLKTTAEYIASSSNRKEKELLQEVFLQTIKETIDSCKDCVTKYTRCIAFQHQQDKALVGIAIIPDKPLNFFYIITIPFVKVKKQSQEIKKYRIEK